MSCGCRLGILTDEATLFQRDGPTDVGPLRKLREGASRPADLDERSSDDLTGLRLASARAAIR
jgi:hypothetical protein